MSPSIRRRTRRTTRTRARIERTRARIEARRGGRGSARRLRHGRGEGPGAGRRARVCARAAGEDRGSGRPRTPPGGRARRRRGGPSRAGEHEKTTIPGKSIEDFGVLTLGGEKPEKAASPVRVCRVFIPTRGAALGSREPPLRQPTPSLPSRFCAVAPSRTSARTEPRGGAPRPRHTSGTFREPRDAMTPRKPDLTARLRLGEADSRIGRNPGGVPKWSTGWRCKRHGLCLRRFESCLPHC
jgi:hypothetical protein